MTFFQIVKNKNKNKRILTSLDNLSSIVLVLSRQRRHTSTKFDGLNIV